MSETKHSPEPWRVHDPGDGIKPGVFVARERGIGVPPKFYVAFLPDMDRGDSLADARRIVACVNACAGIPVEALEAGALAKAMGLLADMSLDRDLACPVCGDVLGAHDDGCALASTLRAIGRLP